MFSVKERYKTNIISSRFSSCSVISNVLEENAGHASCNVTIVASDKLVVEITSEAGRSFLDQMISLIQNSTRPKTKNEIALSMLLAGLSLIFIMVIGTLLFFTDFLGLKADI
ncbi:MAG: hypothetical protein WA421_04630, partial [Nitrososphaeraceae archaeon]